MCAVIFLHYYNAEIGGGIAYVQKGSVNELIMNILEALCISSVNLFVMISAYYLSQTQKRSIDKCINLLLQVSLFRVGLYLFSCCVGIRELTFTSIAGSFLLINWYVVLYVALYLISPLINAAYWHLNCHLKILMTLLVFFSVFNLANCGGCFESGNRFRFERLKHFGMYGSNRGYTITQFVVCYCVGLTLRHYNLKCIKFRGYVINQLHLVLLLIIEVMIITVWGCYINPYTGREYCNPVIILEAMTVFIIFLRNEFEINKVVNEVSASAFSVYLLHSHFLRFAQIKKVVSGSAFLC